MIFFLRRSNLCGSKDDGGCGCVTNRPCCGGCYRGQRVLGLGRLVEHLFLATRRHAETVIDVLWATDIELRTCAIGRRKPWEDAWM